MHPLPIQLSLILSRGLFSSFYWGCGWIVLFYYYVYYFSIYL